MAIQKIDKSKTYKLSNALILNKDDIKYIINLLHQNHINHRNIILDNFSIDYTNEIEKLNLNEASKLEIIGFRNEDEIKIILNSSSSKIIINDEDDAIIKFVSEQIKKYLNKKKNKWDNILLILYIGLPIPIFVITFLINHSFDKALIVTLSFIAGFTAFIGIGTKFLNTKIIIRRKLTFYSRNKDAIIIAILSTFIGVLLGGVITLFLCPKL